MNHHARSHRAPGSDPLLAPTSANRSADRSADRGTPSDAPRRVAGSGSARGRHPARGARALALAASVVATGAGAAGLGYSEGAWGADGSPAAAVTADTAPSTTPSSTAADSPATTDSATTTETPTTTQVAEPAEVTPASGYTDGVYLGSAEYTEWGDVQVQVTIGDGGIVDVAAVQYPTGRRSSSINAQAIPMLEADAIALQSADLDIVSGATYTSRTYADSLQAALDQAALAASQDEGSS